MATRCLRLESPLVVDSQITAVAQEGIPKLFILILMFETLKENEWHIYIIVIYHVRNVQHNPVLLFRAFFFSALQSYNLFQPKDVIHKGLEIPAPYLL